MPKHTRHTLIGAALLLAMGPASRAAGREEIEEPPAPTLEARLAPPFGDNAVLQQGIALPVWGTTLPGAKVTVSLAAQTKTATADEKGAWRVVLDPQARSARQCDRDPEGSGGDRRDGRVRHEDQSRHHDRRDQRGRTDPGQERAARRQIDRGHDQWHVPRRIQFYPCPSAPHPRVGVIGGHLRIVYRFNVVFRCVESVVCYLDGINMNTPGNIVDAINGLLERKTVITGVIEGMEDLAVTFDSVDVDVSESRTHRKLDPEKDEKIGCNLFDGLSVTRF